MRAVLSQIAVVAVLSLGTEAALAERQKYVEVAPPEARRGSASDLERDERSFRLLRASATLGEEVVNPDAEPLGRIQDLAVDLTRQRVAYAVLECGRVLGVESRLFAVPWPTLTKHVDGAQKVQTRDRLTLKADRQRLEEARGFEIGEWPDMADQRWATDVHTFYGQVPYWERPRGTELRGEPISPAGSRRQSSPRSERQERPLVLKANVELMGHAVQHASNGEILGEIDDILFDQRTGDVAFVVLRLNPGTSVTRTQREKDRVALPVQMFSFNRQGDPNAPYMIECCLDNLKSHRFSSNRWPDLRSRDWARSLYADFGRTPYWEQR